MNSSPFSLGSRRVIPIRGRPVLLLALALFLTSVAPSRGTDAALAGAADRIQEHRMAGGTVHVVNSQGDPVVGAAISVEQTRHAFLFGSNIYAWGRLGDPKLEEEYRRRFADVFNYATIGFYWAAYEPKPGRPNHDYAESVARWCAENGITAKGHPLAWNHADPRWLPGDLEEIHRLQMDRIEDCVARMAGLIDRWDVVNEAVHFEREEMVRRAPKTTAMWERAGRVEFAIECFDRAAQANPEALLLINDYRVDPPYERLIEQLVRPDGRPVYHVIGLQSHMHGGIWSNERIWDVCERFSRFGVPLHFTELTILSGKSGWELGSGWESTPEGEAEQAREVERVYTLLFSHPAVEAITWWDFSDARAWQGAPAGFLRKDMTPKPAYQVLHSLIKDRWWTRAEASTNDKGEALFRGFLGEYRVTVRSGEKEAAGSFSLARDRENRWVIRVP